MASLQSQSWGEREKRIPGSLARPHSLVGKLKANERLSQRGKMVFLRMTPKVFTHTHTCIKKIVIHSQMSDSLSGTVLLAYLQMFHYPQRIVCSRVFVFKFAKNSEGI